MSSNIHRLEREAGNNRIAISLSYIDESNHRMMLERVWQPRKTKRGVQVEEPLLLEESLILWEDGEQVQSWTQEEIQAWIESEIPNSTSKFFFFDGEQVQQFAQEEDESSRLKDSIELLLGIELFRGLKQHLTDYIVKPIRVEASQHSEVCALRLQADVKEIEAAIQKISEEIQIRETDLKAHRERDQRLEEQKATLLKYIDPQSQGERDRLAREFGKKETELKVARDERQEFVQKHFPFVLILDELSLLKDSLRKEREIRVEQDANLKLHELLNDFVEQVFVDTHCLCGADLTEDQARKLQKDFAHRVETFFQSTKAVESGLPIFGLSEEQERSAAQVIDDLHAAARPIKSFLDREQQTRAQLESLQDRILMVTPDESIAKDLKRIDFQSKDVSGLVARTKAEIDQLRTQREAKDKALDEKEHLLSEAQERAIQEKQKIMVLEKTKKIIALLDEYIDLLRKAKLAELKQHTTTFFNKLQSKSVYHGTINFDETSYATSIVLANGRVIRKLDLSAGEKELYALSLIAGLCKTAHKIMPVIIDTPLSRLDSHNRQNVVEKYYPEAGKQVVLLSTDEEVYGRYYESLKEYILQTFLLRFDENTLSTHITKGYFPD